MGRGVIFDLDGTLVDTNYLHVIAWSRAFADAGQNVPIGRSTALSGVAHR